MIILAGYALVGAVIAIVRMRRARRTRRWVPVVLIGVGTVVAMMAGMLVTLMLGLGCFHCEPNVATVAFVVGGGVVTMVLVAWAATVAVTLVFGRGRAGPSARNDLDQEQRPLDHGGAGAG